ncbi:MAG: hypothetical protein J6L00_00490 [Clostridia bacterium]|jgi:hypothetical protein|nr:hypothetical protein [Clostridia bacterium]
MQCEMCVYYTYDEYTDSYECLVSMDEDEVYRLHSGLQKSCPYFREDDEYAVVRKQN